MPSDVDFLINPDQETQETGAHQKKAMQEI
jgi:hypothetical protein